jgi:hypothetical protein
MGKITVQSPGTEAIRHTTDEPNGDLCFALHYDDTVTHITGITPLYDDEIGLWEELEHRHSFGDDAIK